MAVIGLDVSPWKRKLMEAGQDARQAGDQIRHALSEGVGEKLETLGSFAVIEETIRRAIEFSEQVENMSNRLGISTDAVQRWDHALKMSGSSIEAAQGFFVKLAVAKQKAMEGDEKMIDHFQRLGVSLEDLKSGRLEDIGQQISIKIESGDVQKMLADIRAVGGRGAVELAGAFKNEFGKKLQEAPVASEPALNELRNLGEGLKTIWRDILVGTVGILGPIIGGIRMGLQEVLAVFVGIGKGAVKMWQVLSEPVSGTNPIESIKKTAKAFKAGFTEMTDTVKDFNEGNTQMEVDRLNRQKEAQGLAGLGEGDEAGLSGEKQKKINKLKEEAAKITKEAAIAELSGVEKQRAMLTEINELRQKMAAEKDQEKQAEIGVSLAHAEANLVKDKARTEKEIARIKEDTAKTGFETSLREMDAGNRIAAITERIAQLKAQIAKEEDPLKAAQLEKEKSRFESELSREKKEQEKQEKREAAKAFTEAMKNIDNPNVRVGAYGGGDPMLSVGQGVHKSNEHLSAILKVLHTHTKMMRSVRH